MTNFITIDDREYNVGAIFNFGIVEDEAGDNFLEIVLQSGQSFDFADDEADTIYNQLMAIKTAAAADASRLATAIDKIEAYAAGLTQRAEAVPE